MAWLFLPGGLLMPAAVPQDKADTKLTDNGRFDLQVRARVESHLTNFIRDYMDPMGLEYSEIEKTPQMDYNCRFYTTKEQFAQAIAAAMLDIDYKKFKPTAERKDADGKPLYEDGKSYHGVLNSIWGTVTRLGRPGGVWANPNYSGYASPKNKNSVGSTFYDDSWFSNEDRLRGEAGMDVPDYSPVEEIEDILAEMEGIPVDQWDEFLTMREMNLMEPYLNGIRREEKRRNKRNAKISRRESRKFKKARQK